MKGSSDSQLMVGVVQLDPCCMIDPYMKKPMRNEISKSSCQTKMVGFLLNPIINIFHDLKFFIARLWTKNKTEQTQIKIKALGQNRKRYIIVFSWSQNNSRKARFLRFKNYVFGSNFWTVLKHLVLACKPSGYDVLVQNNTYKVCNSDNCLISLDIWPFNPMLDNLLKKYTNMLQSEKGLKALL